MFRRRSIALAGVGIGLTVGIGCVEKPSSAQAAKELVERGRYLVVFGSCDDCHSPKVMTPNGPVPDSSRRLSGHPASDPVPPLPVDIGGPGQWGAAAVPDLTAWVGPWGVSFPANLTPDPTGLEPWTEAQFIQTMRTGRHLGVGRALLPPMPWFSLNGLTDGDLRAIFAYLRSLPPVSNVVPAPIPPAAASGAPGT